MGQADKRLNLVLLRVRYALEGLDEGDWTRVAEFVERAACRREAAFDRAMGRLSHAFVRSVPTRH